MARPINLLPMDLTLWDLQTLVPIQILVQIFLPIFVQATLFPVQIVQVKQNICVFKYALAPFYRHCKLNMTTNFLFC